MTSLFPTDIFSTASAKQWRHQSWKWNGPDHLDGQLILAEVVADFEDCRNDLVVLRQEGQLQRQRVRWEVGGRSRVDPAGHQPRRERDQSRVRVSQMFVQLKKTKVALTFGRLTKDRVRFSLKQDDRTEHERNLMFGFAYSNHVKIFCSNSTVSQNERNQQNFAKKMVKTESNLTKNGTNFDKKICFGVKSLFGKISPKYAEPSKFVELMNLQLCKLFLCSSILQKFRSCLVVTWTLLI